VETKTLTRLIALVGVLGALTVARDARAQAGDLDILSRSVPPVVMIQFDTSGSMQNIILPQKYLTDRGAGSPTNWFNTPTNHTGTPLRLAAELVNGTSASGTNFNSAGGGAIGGGNENYRRTCQIFPNTSSTSTGSICAPGTTGCQNDDADGNSPQAGAVLRCWKMPSAVAGSCPPGVPTPLRASCTTVNRNRIRGTTAGSTSSFTSQPYTTIILPNYSINGQKTDYPVNYLWWLMNEIYLGNTPVPFIDQDRNGAGRQAITNLVNDVNVDGLPPKVKFGLARYSENAGDDNGGYVIVPAALNNKATLLDAITNQLPASGNTPLSETLVDVARYLAGADKFGTYPQYDRNVSGATDAANAPASPITSSCEKIFVVVITDGLPTSDNNNHYGTSVSGKVYYSTFKNTMSPIDADTDLTDDVARKLYATDLRPTMSGNQNVITYAVGFSLDSPLLQEVATEGHGTYYSSNNADELASSLTGAIQDILARNTSLTSATVPASRTAFGDGFYTAYFLPTGRKSVWPGHVEAYTFSPSLEVLDDANEPAIDPVTNLFVEPRNPHWDAASVLLDNFASRTIYTTKSGTRVPFTAANLTDPNSSASSLTPTMLGLTSADKTLYPISNDPNAITDPNAPAGNLERLGDSIINFMHGYDAFDEDADGSRTDARPFVLGDIFHSNPVAVGPPLPFLRFDTGYGPAATSGTFMNTFAHRDRVLYVGSNDGMLHGFAAGSFADPNTSVSGDEYYTPGDGHELFGFVPSTLLTKVKQLPKEDIGKVYYVDGSPSAADAWIDYNGNGTKDGTDWTTVLITPMREGAESLLALDVTDPAATSGNHYPYPRYMWEFTNAKLGQTWSKPIITRVKLRGGTGTGDKCGVNDGDVDCVEQWVAIFGAGYRKEGDPNTSAYTNDPNNATYTTKGRGVFMVSLSNGQVLASLSQDPNSTTFAKMKYAIPAEPTVLDLNSDGFADLIYVGDLGGQLWKWDISAIGVTTAGVVPTTVWPAGVMFEAPVVTMDAGLKHYHSIFQSAAAALSNSVLTLSFASGERADLGYTGAADPNDPNNPLGKYDDNNRFWVLFDRTPKGTGAFPATVPAYEEPLAPAVTPLSGHQILTDITDLATDPNTTDAGYFFRVPDGEKFISNSLIFAGTVATVSYLPDAAGAGDDGNCALGGTTYEWAWDLNTGGGSLDDPQNANQTVRSLTLGNGAPTDPRITVSKDENGKIVVKITAQTSMGEILHPDGAGNGFDPVEMVYWRQNF
jgi:Tfp pilus tip-associated adhesin PilY1